MTTYYDRFKGNENTKKWNKVEFVAGRCLQSAELNEAQSIASNKIAQMGGAIWKEGDLISGHDYSFTTMGTSAAILVQDGQLFINGEVRTVTGTPSASPVAITGVGEEVIGVKVTETYITENDDADLRDPAEGFDNYNSAGAHRSTLEFEWSLCTGDGSDGIIPVIRILDGVGKLVVRPTIYSNVLSVMQRRTYDESGNYTVNDFPTNMKWTTENKTAVLEIDQGKAYVEGVEIETGGTRRISFSVNNNYDSVSAESLELYDDNQRLYELDNPYVRHVSLLTAQVEGSFSVIKGSSGSTDDILTRAQSEMDSYISSLVDIRGVAAGSSPTFDFDTNTWSGATTVYAETTDWIQSGSFIDWSPAGAEPGVGTTYYIAAYFDREMVLGERTFTSTSETVTKNGWLGVPRNLTVVPSTSASPSGSYYMYSVTAITELGETTPITATTLLGPAIPSATEYIELDWDEPANNGNTDVPTLTGYRIYRNYPNTRVMGFIAEVDETTTKYTDDGTDALNYNYLPTTRNTTGRDKLTNTDLYGVTSITYGTTTYTAGTDYIVITGNDPGVITVPSKVYALEIGEGIIDWLTTITTPTSGDTYTVAYDYWDHTVEGDFVCANSYVDFSQTTVPDEDYVTFTKTPTYITRSTGTVERLTNYIDFRTTGSGVYHPREGDSPTAIYTYFRGRIDLIYLSSIGNFYSSIGEAENYPTKPALPARALALCYVTIPPYVYSLKDMIISKFPSKRYTMLDIRKLEERIATLEYYQARDNLDREAITSEVDSDEAKRGIFTDLFMGHGKADVFHSEYNCSMDSINQILQLPFSMGAYDYHDYLNITGSTVQQNDKSITLPYTLVLDETAVITQPFATEASNVNPYDVFNWTGYLKLTPESDFWVDTNTLPDLKVNFEGENSNYQASDIWSTTSWSEWQKISTGTISSWEFRQNSQEVQNLIQYLTEAERTAMYSAFANGASSWNYDVRSRTGETSTISIVPETITKSIGDRVVDVSKITYIRSRTINVIGSAFKPNHSMKVYFENVEMDIYTTNPGDLGASGSTTVTTTSGGDFECNFDIPTSTFYTGIRTVRAESANGLDESFGEAKYSAEGIIQTKQTTYMSIINNTFIGKRSQTVEYDINGNPYYPPTPDPWTDPSSYSDPYDPLAQTFFTDDIYFVSSIDLYFQSKDPTLPVSVEIRTVSNSGFPTQTLLGSATVQAAQVQVSEDASIPTNFVFSDPVILDSGKQYCMAIWTKSTNYNIWLCKVGDYDITTGERVTQQPNLGVFFQSQNGYTWSEDQMKDLKFTMYRCNFQGTGTSPTSYQLSFSNMTGVQGFLFALNTTTILPQGATVKWAYSTDGGSNWVYFDPLIDMKLSSVFSQIRLKADFQGLRNNISPMLNAGNIGLITVVYQDTGAYVSKIQTFSDACYQIHMYLDMDTNGQTVNVFVELEKSGEWLSLGTSTSTRTASYDSNYTEHYWKRPISSVSYLPSYSSDYASEFVYDESTGKTYYGNSGTTSWKELTYIANGEFENIRVKIEMIATSTPTALTPEIKRLRLICNGV